MESHNDNQFIMEWIDENKRPDEGQFSDLRIVSKLLSFNFCKIKLFIVDNNNKPAIQQPKIQPEIQPTITSIMKKEF